MPPRPPPTIRSARTTCSRSPVRSSRRGRKIIASTGSYSARGVVERGGPAVVVLAQWNARWEEQQAVCRWLSFLGITAVKMSLPYHDRRAIPDHPRGDHLVGPNIGLTIQANRQAVVDVRRTLRWLEQQGYDRLGVLGTSIGSSIAFITTCHEPAVRASAHLHAATYFGDVVANGLTTMNVWESMRDDRQARRNPPLLVAHQPVSVHFETSRHAKENTRHHRALRSHLLARIHQRICSHDSPRGCPLREFSLPCGHYSMGVGPFKYAAGYRFGTFLRRALA